MTHKEIFTKFMIEYDKANIAASYPSLTKHEVAALLNKAYVALISQKISGNNFRKAQFEQDSKAIEDIRPLVTTKQVTQSGQSIIPNDKMFVIDSQLMYFLQGRYGNSNVSLINHQSAQSYMQSDTNYPWIEQPVCYLENNYIHLLLDPSKVEQNKDLYITYVKKPIPFTAESMSYEIDNELNVLRKTYSVDPTIVRAKNVPATQTSYTFNVIGTTVTYYNNGNVSSVEEPIEFTVDFNENVTKSSILRSGEYTWNEIKIKWELQQNGINPPDESKMYTVTIGPSNGNGAVYCRYNDTTYTYSQQITVPENTILELEARPNEGCVLTKWNDGSTSLQILRIVTEDISITANMVVEWGENSYSVSPIYIDLGTVGWDVTSKSFTVGITISRTRWDGYIETTHKDVTYTATFEQNTTDNIITRTGQYELYGYTITWKCVQDFKIRVVLYKEQRGDGTWIVKARCTKPAPKNIYISFSSRTAPYYIDYNGKEQRAGFTSTLNGWELTSWWGRILAGTTDQMDSGGFTWNYNGGQLYYTYHDDITIAAGRDNTPNIGAFYYPYGTAETQKVDVECTGFRIVAYGSNESN